MDKIDKKDGKSTPVEQTVVSTGTFLDGRSYEVMELKGKHLMQAQMITQGNPAGLMLALVALGIRIDDKQVIYEDLLEEDAFVVMEIMRVVMGDEVENFSSAMPGA